MTGNQRFGRFSRRGRGRRGYGGYGGGHGGGYDRYDDRRDYDRRDYGRRDDYYRDDYRRDDYRRSPSPYYGGGGGRRYRRSRSRSYSPRRDYDGGEPPTDRPPVAAAHVVRTLSWPAASVRMAAECTRYIIRIVVSMAKSVLLVAGISLSW